MTITPDQANALLVALNGNKELFNIAYSLITNDPVDTDWQGLEDMGCKVYFYEVELVGIFAGMTVTEFA